MIDYTVKEIADLLGVSKTTIQKAIKAAAIDYDYVERNKYFYKLGKVKEIISSIRPDFDFTKLANSQTETDNSQTETNNQTDNSQMQGENSQAETANSQTETDNQTANSQTETDNQTDNSQTGEIAALHRLIDLVQQQLAEKDKQLEIKDKQIAALNDRLAEAMQLTQGQQYIAAADKTKQLMESKAAAEAPIEVTPAPATKNGETDPLAAVEPPPKKGFWSRFFGR